VSILSEVRGPGDLRRLSADELDGLAREIRHFLVAKVSRTGGHLGPNLGAVELTLALHRVFRSPQDVLLWDTGHQSYVHKMLTGRQAGFDELRREGGLSGYPSRTESPHDYIENSHASTALSYADGMAKAFALSGEHRRVVAVVGDGALTGGMCWEALNNIAAAKDRPVVIVVNDNGRSYAPTIGGLAAYLGALRLRPEYEHTLKLVRETVSRTPVVGGPLYDALHGVKQGLKDVFAPQGLFEDLGLKYVGPVDGHDVHALELALRRAAAFGEPVVVHCLTRKGQGYRPAESHDEDKLHGPGAFDPATGQVHPKPGPTWTNVFSEALVGIGRDRPDVVAITAAMLEPTGLGAFSRAFPERTFDVGIAEQHAVTSAAGLAMAGMHPVVAVYSTFLNRAFDQVLLDASLHRLPVTFVLDRAGVTGDDGASHNGMWDLSVFGVVPGLRIAAPRDGTRLEALLAEAVAVPDGPTLVRFPKGKVAEDLPAVGGRDGIDILYGSGSGEVMLLGVGAMAGAAVEAAERLGSHGIEATVVDPRWVLPVNPALVGMAAEHRLVVTVEDGLRVGGVGSRVSLALDDAGVDVPHREIGLPQEFLAHASRSAILARTGLTGQDIARQVVEWVARLHEAAPRQVRADGVSDQSESADA
jgi:1-deoxy-D-xylulose-5-phosphate synthase